MKRPLKLPRPVADELTDFARRAGRSTGFLARRALAAARGKAAAIPAGDPVDLKLTLDEDDDKKTLARVEELLAERGGDPGGALASAWLATRADFLAWLSRVEQADRAADASDLDAELAAAADQHTPPDRLTQLATSPYVQVRIRVARHPSTPAATVEKLAKDRERAVREAVAAR